RCKNRCNPSSYEEKNEGDGVENEATESEAEPGKRSRVAQDRGCAGLKSERRQEDAAGNEHEQQERENLGVVSELHSRRSDFLSQPQIQRVGTPASSPRMKGYAARFAII